MIRACLMALLAMACPLMAAEDGWPALYDVTDVSKDDHLNVRASPDPGADVIGTLAHDATDIEIITANRAGTWGLVNFGEQSGWVSLRYLARHPDQHDHIFPDVRFCAGTEPFWSMHRDGGTVTFDMPLDDDAPLSEPLIWEKGTVNHRKRYSFRTSSFLGVLSRGYCDDGMSDQEFGIELNLIHLGQDIHLQGCCSIQPPSGSL